MYRFGSIKDLTTMTNICMYIRIYNELDKKGKGVQETAIHDYIVDNYEKDIPLFDLFEFKRLASTITGKETVPTIQELDAIIGEYIKYVDKNAIALYKYVEADKKALNIDKFTTYTKESYTGSELCAIENTVRSKFKALKEDKDFAVQGIIIGSESTRYLEEFCDDITTFRDLNKDNELVNIFSNVKERDR